MRNSVKRHIFDAKNLGLGHDLPISLNDSDFPRILFSQK